MIQPQPDLELTTTEAGRVLEAWLGGRVVCSAIRPLAGGMVNTVLALEFDRSPHHAVIKLHDDNLDRFDREARSLQYLRTQTACPVPEVYLLGDGSGLISHDFLLLERLPGECLDGVEVGGRHREDIETQLAEVLAELHAHTGPAFGTIGSDDGEWVDVFTAMLDEARAYPGVEKRLPPDVVATVDEAIAQAPAALEDSGPPALVHGDVWDGNMLVDLIDGRWRVTGLLDPDLRFADAEYELAYLEAFDTPRDTFFAAYAKHHDLRPGYEERRRFYWLRTGLLHVGLFDNEVFDEFTTRIAREIVESG
jgi:fructosamine-3-kinase